MTAFSQTNGDSSVSGDFSKLEKIIEGLSKKFFVDIGILGAAGKIEGGKITLAGVGAVHEFGTDKAGRGKNTVILQRSFIRMPLETGQSYIESQIGSKVKILIEKGDIKNIFVLIGIAGEARIQEAFETAGFGTWPDITEETKKAKGSDAILQDIGALKQAVTSKVGGE